MSLLWIQGAWYNAKPGTEEWDEHGFGHEDRTGRQERYIQQVQQAHGVDRTTALHALKHVTRHLLGRAPQVSPTQYGFASAPDFSGDHHDLGTIDSITGARWRRTPATDVPLDVPVHASQWFVTPRNIAHNLFHPGKRPSPYADEDEHGHPDVEPKRWSREDLADEKENERESGPTNATRMIRQTDGSLLAVDGHHRIATDLLLGKPTTRARVIDIRELGGRRQPPASPTRRPATGMHRTDIPHEPGTLSSCWGCDDQRS